MIDRIYQEAAQREMASTGVTFGVALARVKQRAAEGVQARQAYPKPTTLGTTAVVPAMPPAGAVTDVRTARAHLSAAMPGWAHLSNDQQQHAAITLRDMVKQQAISSQLSRVGANQKPTVLLGLWPGANRFARARAYLRASQPGFASLTNDQQFERVRSLQATHNLLDLQGAA